MNNPQDLFPKIRRLPMTNILRKDNSVRVHPRNLQFLATEIFKVKNDLAPKIIKDYGFQFREAL